MLKPAILSISISSIFILSTCSVGAAVETPLQFRARMIDTFCVHQRDVCCVGQPFNSATCAAILFTGYEFSGMQLDMPGVNQANVKVRKARADACIAKLQTQACDNTGIPASQIQSATRQCFKAFRGIVPAGGSCAADIECVDEHYCETGACAPLKTSGQACHATDPYIGNNCSTRGSGDTGLYCGPASTCVPVLGLGSPCVVNAQCASGSCNPSAVPLACGNTHTDAALCSYFAP